MNSTEGSLTCKNCQHQFTGNFCNHCGEKAYHRLNVNYLISNAFQYVFNLERGFLFTFWELTIKPGKVIQDYFKGKRKIYHPPFSYLILSIALISLSTLLVSTAEQTEMLLGSQSEPNNNDFNFSPEEIGEYVKYFLFGIIPFISLFTYWFFKKSKFNYAEHLVVNTYAMAQLNFINFISVVILFFLPNKSIIIVDSIATLVQLIYLAWAHNQLFKNGVLGVVKSLFSFLFAIFSIILLIFMALIAFKVSTVNN